MAEAIVAAVEVIGLYLGESVATAELGAFIFEYAAVIVTVGELAAVAAYTNAQQRRAEAKARDAYNSSLRDRYVMVRNALEPRSIVLGSQRVSGPMTFVGSYGDDRENLVFVVPVAGHEIRSYGKVYFGDEPVDLAADGTVLGVLRTETFAIAAATGTYTLAGDTKEGHVVAVAKYGSESVTLGVSGSGTDTISVSGARAGQVGVLEISYRPDPDPYHPEDPLSRTEVFAINSVPQTVTLQSVPIGPPTVVESGPLHGTPPVRDPLGPLAFTISGAALTITSGTQGHAATVTYTYSNGESFATVRKYYGRPKQAADAGMIAALPGMWTADHRGDGIAYLVVQLVYEPSAFPGGIPNVSAEVNGLMPYDPRRNRIHSSAQMQGARAGTPGTLPLGWSISLPAGVTWQVVYVGTDRHFGMPCIDLRFTGTASATGDVIVRMRRAEGGTEAAGPGDEWGARVRLSKIAGAWGWTGSSRVQLVSTNSSGSLGEMDYAAIAASPANEEYELQGAVAQSDAIGVYFRVRLQAAGGVANDSTVRIILPQLWPGELSSTTDDVEHWTDSPALLTRGYAVHPLGGRLPGIYVDDDSVTEAANLGSTSASYTVGGQEYTRSLYRCGYVAKTDQRPTDVLTDLCQAMGGRWLFTDGKLRLIAGSYRIPVETLDESWLLGDQPIQLQPGLARADTINQISGTFADASQHYQVVAFDPVAPGNYALEDGGPLPVSIDFPSITFAGQVQYVAASQLRAGRQEIVVRVVCNMRAWRVEAYDVLLVSLTRYGWVKKPFEVQTAEWSLEGGIELVLCETDASTWDMDAGFPDVDPAPNTRLPDPWNLPPIENLQIQSGAATLLLQPDGTVVPRILATWNRVTDARILYEGQIELRWGLATVDEADHQSDFVPGDCVQDYLLGVKTGLVYLVKARTVGALAKSAWSLYASNAVGGKDQAPANVSNLDYRADGPTVTFRWDKCPDVDYLTTEFRRGSWNAPAETLRFTGTTGQWISSSTSATDWYARHVDRSGNFSASSAHLSVTTSAVAGIPAVAATIILQGDDPGIRFETDGSRSRRLTTQTPGLWYSYGYWIHAGYFAQPVIPDIGDDYWIRFSQVGTGDAPDGGPLDTWLHLNVPRSLFPNGFSASYLYEIATSADDDSIVGTGTIVPTFAH